MPDKRIKKIREGVYRIRISAPVDPLTGKRDQPSRTCYGSLADAEKMLYSMLLQRGVVRIESGNVTLQEVFNLWIEAPSVRMRQRTPNTKYKETRRFLKHVNPVLGGRKITSITKTDVIQLYERLVKIENLSPNSVRRIHELISAVFSWAVEHDLLMENPILGMKRRPRQEVVAPSAPAFESVVETLTQLRQENPDLWLMVRLAATVAPRRGELCALRWRHLDLQRGVVSIHESVTWTPQIGNHFSDTKTGRLGFGQFGLDEELVVQLRQLRVSKELAANACGIAIEDCFVFHAPGSLSEPINGDLITSRLRKFYKRNPNLQRFTLRKLRAFVSTETPDLSADLTTTQAILRHSSSTTTARYYRAPRADRIESTTRSLGQHLAIGTS